MLGYLMPKSFLYFYKQLYAFNDLIRIIIIEALLVYWLSLQRVDTVTQAETLNKAVCYSQSVDTIGKSINPTILLPDVSKL